MQQLQGEQAHPGARGRTPTTKGFDANYLAPIFPLLFPKNEVLYLAPFSGIRMLGIGKIGCVPFPKPHFHPYQTSLVSRSVVPQAMREVSIGRGIYNIFFKYASVRYAWILAGRTHFLINSESVLPLF